MSSKRQLDRAVNADFNLRIGPIIDHSWAGCVNLRLSRCLSPTLSLSLSFPVGCPGEIAPFHAVILVTTACMYKGERDTLGFLGGGVFFLLDTVSNNKTAVAAAYSSSSLSATTTATALLLLSFSSSSPCSSSCCFSILGGYIAETDSQPEINQSVHHIHRLLLHLIRSFSVFIIFN